jgi:uncharacterized protein YbcC (UPF0753/DUF2309 family)
MADKFKSIVEKVSGLLPAQGPITSFAFLNTLQALENLPFRDGLLLGASLYHCQPFLPEETYHHHFEAGRINEADLLEVLDQRWSNEPCASIFSKLSRRELRLLLLEHPLQLSNSRELEWFVAETDALKKFRSDVRENSRSAMLLATKSWVHRELQASSAFEHRHITQDGNPFFRLAKGLLPHNLRSIENWSDEQWEAITLKLLWRICLQGVLAAQENERKNPESAVSSWRGRHRNHLLSEVSIDSDAWVHETLIRFCGGFIDQGFASWHMPARDKGFFACFVQLLSMCKTVAKGPQRELKKELERIKQHSLTAEQVFSRAIEELGVGDDELERFVAESVLALRGWAGMIWQLESRPDRAVRALPKDSFFEFVAIRFLLDVVSLRACLTQLGKKTPVAAIRLPSVRPAKTALEIAEVRAFSIFQLAQVSAIAPPELFSLSVSEWGRGIREIEIFSEIERRSILHEAYERHFRWRALRAIAVHKERAIPEPRVPSFQIVFCIDAREESFRRHLEELDPECKTFGTAGFFGIPIRYKGVADANYASLCPIVLRPKYWVNEEVVFSLEDVHERRAWARRTLGTASHRLHLGSRTFTGGALVTTLLGSLASIPLIARILFPTLTARLKKSAGVLVEPPPVTRLRIEREAVEAGPGDEQIGLSLGEMVQHCETALRDIGLTSHFAGVVLWVGHGSQCMNNPHESAYDCGACSGNSGGPNARLLAAMLNDSRVREKLAERSIAIPAETYFVAAQHNTCNDSMTYYDLASMPSRKVKEFKQIRQTISEACMRNAHERCRQFETADLSMTFAAAHRHVEARSEDLAQTRPEYGNASNALCLVGRRDRFRGLFFGRRSFMMSYNPTQDDENSTILARILSAVVPVCSGINMQYTLSAMDPVGWGCGSKLPHNVTSLLGVMDGAMSDMRTGLPLQGTDIHEPMRLLFVIETTPDSILSIMKRNETVGRILGNGWAQLAILNPKTNELCFYDEGRFRLVPRVDEKLPEVEHSIDWYGGKRNHLEIALIRKGLNR